MRDDTELKPDTHDATISEKRPYTSPVLTRYGTLDELIDSGAVLGTAPSIILLLTS
jgi:hypothetical protein